MPSLGSLVEQATSFVAGQLLGSDTVDGQAQFQSTRVIASFHTDEGFDGAVDSSPESSGNGGLADIGGAIAGGIGSAIGGAASAIAGLGGGGDDSGPQPFRILGVQTHKAFGGNAGTWTLTVKGRSGTDVQRLWADPEDVWVRIVIVKNGVPTEVSFGLMNTVTEGMTRADNGARSVTYTLVGEDFHKVMTATQLYINMHENAGTLPIIKMYDAVKTNLIGPPDSTIDTLVCGWLGNNGLADKQWKLPKSLGGGYFFDMLERKLEECRGNIYDPALYSPDQFMGKSLWSSLEEYSNGILNELFVRTFEEEAFDASKPPRPQLVLRERPFPSKDKGHDVWDALTTHVLKPGDVKGRNMTKGAPESRFNYWLLDGKGLLGDSLSVQMQMMQETGKEGGIPGSAPVYNMEDIRLHGFRRFSQGTRYFPFREDVNWFTHSAEWLKLLHDWYAVAPFEISGTLEASTIQPKIRLGERIREERKNATVTYYVEGVGHSWQYPGPGLSTLNLTRGEFEGEDLLDQVYERAVAAAGDTSADIGGALALVDSVLGLNVPTGSGQRLDKQVGQVDTPERLYLKQRGIDTGSTTAQDRGEPQNPNPRVVKRLSPSDLPDQLVPDDAEIAVGRAKPRERRQGGNLTQRELEQGVRLPVREEGIAPTERSKETEAQAIDRWRKTGKR